MGPGAVRVVHLAGTDGLPKVGVADVAVQVTATSTTARSFATLYPTGTRRPNTQNVTWAIGATATNEAIVPLGRGGDIDIYNATGRAQVSVSVIGFVTSPAADPPEARSWRSRGELS